jgi:hypothetical protein
MDLIDAAAMEAHDVLDTRPAHQMLAKQIWTTLRGLGLTHGWVPYRPGHPAPHGPRDSHLPPGH